MEHARPTTVEAYILAAPAAGLPHLRALQTLLRSIAPDADECIKWGSPFYVEPRFLFAFSAHKAHANFTPCAASFAAFQQELSAYKTTKGSLQILYKDPFPEAMVRRLAEHSYALMKGREDTSFW